MLYEFDAGSTPLLVDVPHAGTELPGDIAECMSVAALPLPDTDWHVDRLADVAEKLGASVLRARISRYVIDLNRGSDDKPLYVGPTTGLVPTETFDGDPVYAGKAPDPAEQARRIETFWKPYHRQLLDALDSIRRRHGHAVLLDLHSIRTRVPRLFEGRLADLNLGTNDGRSCDALLEESAAEVLENAESFSHVVNGRFKGGFITRHYGRPDEGIHALQLEIAQSCYMDESDPRQWNEKRAAPLMAVLERLVTGLIQWRPS